uniref:Uncharacterized protein n=1 Tax=Chromera velia CCMP2878 TaxID=1169474 RepID=A0A0G4GXY4_9ALVE|eukprot:Cvel_5387.t1-p1 / transcript=Cvel_5387.t1 / gene=Cvel_5387 / organism=Chromera_velia_CCMP2878 / gene_product=hypothetical protein / transcript_product=hypothetical protein / location=Cvel_scaffold250:91723-92499(+) / protein_length=259 / sequence_SO=supercontig / SO=protein_coding / is_pseudo=false
MTTVEGPRQDSDDRSAAAEQPKHDSSDRTAVIEAVCSDGKVAMSAAEFKQVVNAGDILGSLVYGHPGMRSEARPKYDVFRTYGVSRKVLNVIRACIRGNGTLPQDRDALALAVSGDLRHSAETLGGFPLVNEALKQHEAKQEENQRATVPLADRAGIYEWRNLIRIQTSTTSANRVDFQRAFNALGMKGFMLVSERDVESDSKEYVFRRPKDSTQGNAAPLCQAGATPAASESGTPSSSSSSGSGGWGSPALNGGGSSW